MEVIVIESAAFHKLIEQVTRPLIDEIRTIRKELSDQSLENAWMEEDEVMKLLKIKSHSWFSEYRVKNNLPCHKVGRRYAYKRSEIIGFVEKRRANR
ncbi:MAG: hypothetical protein WCK09_22225 [Bacteroidota bacterium]